MGKKARRNAHVRPNERYYQVHEMIGRRGGVTFDTIKNTYWHGRKDQTCLDKLEQWKRDGSITTLEREVDGQKVLLWVLTDRGLQALPQETQAHCYKTPPTAIETRHVLRVNEYLAFLGNRVTTFKNERELRSLNIHLEEEQRDPEVTDGYIQEAGGEGYFIEIDSGDTGERLAHKCAGLKSSGKRTKVIVRSKARLRTFVKALGNAAHISVELFHP